MPKPQSELPDNQVKPAPELEKRTRRRFTTEYKLRIIAEADQCAHGELGVLLPREGLYSSQLQQWRKEVENNDGQTLTKTSRARHRVKHLSSARSSSWKRKRPSLRRSCALPRTAWNSKKNVWIAAVMQALNFD